MKALLFLIMVLIIFLSGNGSAEIQDDNFPTCGDCFCAPESGQECPYDQKPQTDYSDLIPILREFTWENPTSLDCDPYFSETCNTSPPLQQGGACVVDITPNTDTICPDNWSYSTQTYSGTYQEALEEGLHVTHSQACGACSSLQDLAAYMETGPALQDLASKCGFRGQVNATLGIQCFLDLGFTEGCANIWYANTNATSESCFWVCTKYTIAGNGSNAPPPSCELAECLNCDEVNSGPIFKQYAGRARCNSGLLSGIVRNCSEVIPLEQNNPCDEYGSGNMLSSTSLAVKIGCVYVNGMIGLAGAVFYGGA